MTNPRCHCGSKLDVSTEATVPGCFKVAVRCGKCNEDYQQCSKCDLWFPEVDPKSEGPCLDGVGDEVWCIFCDAPDHDNSHATPGVRVTFEDSLESRIADQAFNDPDSIDLPVAWKMLHTWVASELEPLGGQDGTAELWKALEEVGEAVDLRLQDKYGVDVKSLDEYLRKRLDGEDE